MKQDQNDNVMDKQEDHLSNNQDSDEEILLDNYKNKQQAYRSDDNDQIQKTSQKSTNSEDKRSELSDILEKNSRLIFQFPDGMYSYAYRCQNSANNQDGAAKKDKWLQVKSRTTYHQMNNQRNNDDISNFQIIQIEDEVSFMMDNLEYLVEPDEAISKYFSDRNFLYLIMSIGFISEIMLTWYIFSNEMYNLDRLKHMYKQLHLKDFKNFFTVVQTAHAAINVVMYTFGYYTVFSHKVTNYQVFLIFLMASIFAGVLLTYVNPLNLLLFLMKCFTYIYTHFVLSELYTVLIIPSDQLGVQQNLDPQNQSDTSNDNESNHNINYDQINDDQFSSVSDIPMQQRDVVRQNLQQQIRRNRERIESQRLHHQDFNALPFYD